MSKFQQDKKQKLLTRSMPSTRKQEHESATSVLRIVTLRNNNPITLRFLKWRQENTQFSDFLTVFL